MIFCQSFRKADCDIVMLPSVTSELRKTHGKIPSAVSMISSTKFSLRLHVRYLEALKQTHQKLIHIEIKYEWSEEKQVSGLYYIKITMDKI